VRGGFAFIRGPNHFGGVRGKILVGISTAIEHDDFLVRHVRILI
jgi:hypothetical protein